MERVSWRLGTEETKILRGSARANSEVWCSKQLFRGRRTALVQDIPRRDSSYILLETALDSGNQPSIFGIKSRLPVLPGHPLAPHATHTHPSLNALAPLSSALDNDQENGDFCAFLTVLS